MHYDYIFDLRFLSMHKSGGGGGEESFLQIIGMLLSTYFQH